MNNVFIHSTQFTQHSSLLIFRQFRLSLKCSQSRRLNNYTLCSIGNCGGNYPISNTTLPNSLSKANASFNTSETMLYLPSSMFLKIIVSKVKLQFNSKTNQQNERNHAQDHVIIIMITLIKRIITSLMPTL